MSDTRAFVLLAYALVASVVGLIVCHREGGKNWRALRGTCRGTLFVSVVGLCSYTTTVLSVGGFPQDAFQITFVDGPGQPVSGVKLRVENDKGDRFFHYPVTDYLPDQVPTSGKDGVMVFHHVTYRGVEWTGRSALLFFVVPLGERGAPRYWCRFLRNGEEVHRIPYTDLINTGRTTEDATWVKRSWKWPRWPYERFLVVEERGVADDPWGELRRELGYPADRRQGRSVGPALRAAERAIGKTMDRERYGIGLVEEELSFRLVERTFVIRTSGQ
jgi:hypothetical protein